MATLVTWANAVAFMGGDEQRLTQYFKGDTSGAHLNFDNAMSVADGMMRSKIGERYLTTAYDALTTSTAPDYMKRHQYALGLSHATQFDEGRPRTIQDAGGIAAGWLDDVVASKARIIELEPVTVVNLQHMASTATAKEARVFDTRTSSTSKFKDIFRAL